MKVLTILTILWVSVFAQAQTTQPAERPLVLVMKFEQVDLMPGFAWLSRSIQQSLLTDINHSNFARAMVLPEARSAPTTDTTIALGLAREQRAQFVVVGGYQMMGDMLRITAQVIDVQKSETIGSLKSTGNLQGLYLMQDGLLTQVRAVIAPNTARHVAVPKEMLEIPTGSPIAKATPMNRYEVVAPQPWEGYYRNRKQFLATWADQCWGGYGWYGWAPCGWPGWW